MVRSICLFLLLGFALPSFGEDEPSMKSILLVARKGMPDPNFRNTVVLVTRSGAMPPIGVIVNRPMGMTLARVFPDIERLRSREDKLFFGGPVSRDELVFVFRAATSPPDTIEILDNVYLSGSRELLRERLGREGPADSLRVFAGHAAWSPGQLEAEVARGDWHLAPADARTIFEKKPETLWQELERRATAVIAWRSSGSTLPVRILSHP